MGKFIVVNNQGEKSISDTLVKRSIFEKLYKLWE